MSQWNKEAPNENQINYFYPVDEYCDFLVCRIFDADCYVWQIVDDNTVVSTEVLDSGAFATAIDAFESMKQYAIEHCDFLDVRDINNVPALIVEQKEEVDWLYEVFPYRDTNFMVNLPGHIGRLFGI